MTTEKMVQRARKRMQEAQDARKKAVNAWIVEARFGTSPAAEREAWRSALHAHYLERSEMGAYRAAAAALKRKHEQRAKENDACEAQRKDAQKLLAQVLALAAELPAEQLARLLIYGEVLHDATELARAGRI